MTAAKTEDLRKRLAESGSPIVVPRPEPFGNFLLYGPGGSGKSAGAASAPGPVLYLNADRENALYFARQQNPDILEVEVTSLKTLVDIGNEVKANPHDWGTVVIDPIADVYRILIEQFSKRSLSPALDTYRDAGTHVERWCRGMCDQPVNFVIVAHDWPVKDESNGTVERLPYTGSNSNATLSTKLVAMVDVVGYTGVVSTKLEDQQEPDVKYMAQLINANGRRGKDRFDTLGKSAEVDLTKWLAQIAESKQPKEAKAA